MQILMTLCMKQQRPTPFTIYANYNPVLTFTYFMAKSKFCHLGVYMEKCSNDQCFGIIASCDLEFSKYSKQNK